jgi:lysophospholipase L1-like esterase
MAAFQPSASTWPTGKRLDVRSAAEGGWGLLYAALGDSITYGYEASTGDAAYVARFVKFLSRNQSVNLFVHAKPGWTSKHLVKSLPKVPDCIWKEAQLITVMMGGNDLLRASPWLLSGTAKNVQKVAQRFQHNLERIVATVRQPRTTCIIATLYNPFPNSALAEECIGLINQSILHIANQYQLAVADVRNVFRNREQRYIKGYKQGSIRDMRLIGNPIHPNDEGHAAIAREFLTAYRRATVSPRKSRQRPSPRARGSSAKKRLGVSPRAT